MPLLSRMSKLNDSKIIKILQLSCGSIPAPVTVVRCSKYKVNLTILAVIFSKKAHPQVFVFFFPISEKTPIRKAPPFRPLDRLFRIQCNRIGWLGGDTCRGDPQKPLSWNHVETGDFLSITGYLHLEEGTFNLLLCFFLGGWGWEGWKNMLKLLPATLGWWKRDPFKGENKWPPRIGDELNHLDLHLQMTKWHPNICPLKRCSMDFLGVFVVCCSFLQNAISPSSTVTWLQRCNSGREGFVVSRRKSLIRAKSGEKISPENSGVVVDTI